MSDIMANTPRIVREEKICKGCRDSIVGFDTNGYCEDCCCEDCGNTMGTENERALGQCEDCEMETGQ